MATSAPTGIMQTVRRVLRPILKPAPPEQMVLDDLLYMAGKTLSMDDLLVAVPMHICKMLRLASFQIFLRDGADYRPEPVPGEPSLREIRFRSSCAMIAHLKREARPVPVHQPEPDAWTLLATDEELDDLQKLKAQFLLPLNGRTGLVGFATLSRSASAHFSEADLRQLQNLGAELGHGLETAQFQKSLSDEAVRRAHANRELELAREVQERLLPQELPQVEGLDLASAYRSAAQVGGDYYDIFPTPAGQVCCVIADVSGKGVPAALLMASLRSSLRSFMLSGQPLTAVLEQMNRLLYDASSSSRYATLEVLLYDPPTATVTSVNVGHNPPMLLRGNKVLRLQCGGPVLGLLPQVSYEQEKIVLLEGDLLVLYTDGITEASNTAGNEWEEAGLLDALQHYRGAPAEEIADKIVRRVYQHARGCEQADDLTLLVLKRTGPLSKAV